MKAKPNQLFTLIEKLKNTIAQAEQSDREREQRITTLEKRVNDLERIHGIEVVDIE